mgnify:CR=1 FL=1
MVALINFIVDPANVYPALFDSSSDLTLNDSTLKNFSEQLIPHELKTYIFEYDADYLRDQDTIESLRTIDKETVSNLLDSTVSPQSRRMINVLTFAENHDNITKVKSSFADLDIWKASRVYE